MAGLAGAAHGEGRGGVRYGPPRQRNWQVSDERPESGRKARATYLRFGTPLSRRVHHNCLSSDHE